MEISDDEYERLMHRSKLMDLAQDILIVLDIAGVILDVNDAAARMHGIPREELIGRSCADFLHPASTKQMLKIAIAMFDSGVDRTDTMNLEAFRHDGETVHLELRVSYSAQEQKFYVVERDVSEQFDRTAQLETLSRELRAQAVTDALTGVPNRAAFEERLAQVIHADESAWLVIIDVDNFKTINDTFGHAVGDRLLTSIARRVSGATQARELFARIGGDEFALIAPAAGEAAFQRRIAELESLVNGEFDVSQPDRLMAKCSVGSAQRRPGETNFSWQRRSDRDMYANKAANRHIGAT